MKNKVGAQKGAFIKMKQENMYIYQWLDGLCYVPIIAPSNKIIQLASKIYRVLSFIVILDKRLCVVLAQVEYNVLTWQLPVPEAERVAELSKHIT
ncbi:hypothetical protein QU885_03095 [Enterobacter kobei]|uniref:hypothetical protein n=1 Tax=Enterobacter kobei TaxID=208224 RepID=UPI00222FC98A|nr:hypothetical protein [Enterobacter kobei]MDM8769192.1 hypothetical protein [Enterobacter kobei]